MKTALRTTTILILAVAFAAGPALARERWLHVRVEGYDHKTDWVNVNVPLSMIEALLPAIETNEFRGGRVHFDDMEIEGIDLPRMLEALREAPDADFVTVRSDDELVRVSKEDGFLKVTVDGHRERVRVMMPMEVVDALIGDGRGELDILGALQALGDYYDGDLVTIEADDGNVRIWIDDSDTGE
jgi:hypothetical protein